ALPGDSQPSRVGRLSPLEPAQEPTRLEASAPSRRRLLQAAWLALLLEVSTQRVSSWRPDLSPVWSHALLRPASPRWLPLRRALQERPLWTHQPSSLSLRPRP